MGVSVAFGSTLGSKAVKPTSFGTKSRGICLCPQTRWTSFSVSSDKEYLISADHNPIGADAVLGEFIDDRLQVIRGANNPDSGDRTADHSGAAIQQCNNSSLARAIGGQKADKQESELRRADHDYVLEAIMSRGEVHAPVRLIHPGKRPDSDEPCAQNQCINQRRRAGNILQACQSEQ